MPLSDEAGIVAGRDRNTPILPRIVYVVDDDSMVRRSLSFALAAAGLKCRAFAAGADFLEEVDQLAPGCVLLDVRMPQMDGIAVLDALKPSLERFAVIVMTGHGDVDIAVQAMKHGACDFIEKPFAETALWEALESGFSSLPKLVRAHAERTGARKLAATLTPRERDVLRGILAGLSSKALGEILGVSARTVEMHRANLLARLQVANVPGAIRIAYLAGFTPL